MQFSPDECAREVLEVVPRIMSGIRGELRRHGARNLSVPQFRTLLFLGRHEGASLSEVAEHIGLTLPSMSTMIDGLVACGLATRRTHPNDRRRMTLALTDRGQAIMRSARKATQAHLVALLRRLTVADCATVVKAMQVLRPIFTEKAT